MKSYIDYLVIQTWGNFIYKSRFSESYVQLNLDKFRAKKKIFLYHSLKIKP